MQLSPRQYQADPTGAAYVQDTRPLMAAMGAQAATQIEGNRMMQETMQKGMQGVENFAARRQLASARAQLGTLDPEAENYGQQLSGLILDNPLAFTNPKTAPIANMAFKQASDENQAKLARKYKLEDMATQFDYQKQLANLNAQYRRRSSSASDPNAVGRRQALNNVYSGRKAEFDAQRKAVTAELNDTVGTARIALEDELRVINEGSRQLDNEYLGQYTNSGVSTGVENTDMSALQASLSTGDSVGDGSFAQGVEEFPLPQDNQEMAGYRGDASIADANLFPGRVEAPASTGMARPAAIPAAPAAEQIPEGIAVPLPQMMGEIPESLAFPASSVPVRDLNQLNQISISEPIGGLLDSGLSDFPEFPGTNEPMGQSAQASPKDIAKSKEVNRNMVLTDSRKILAQERAYKALPAASQQKLIESSIQLHPQVIQASADLAEATTNQASAKRAYEVAKDSQDPDMIASAEATFRIANAAVERSKLNQTVVGSAAFVDIASTGNPFLYNEERQLAAQREREMRNQEILKKIEADAAKANATAKANKATPFGADTLEARIAAENQKPMRIAEETNQQWTGAKSQIVEAVGGQAKLNQVVFDVLQNPLPISHVLTQGANRDVLVMQIEEQISKLIPGKIMGKNFMGKAFDQKAERDGFQGVSWVNVIAALADEMLTKYQAAYSKVMNPTPPSAKPTPSTFKPTTGSSFTSIPE
jgi:hypothetical protein